MITPNSGSYTTRKQKVSPNSTLILYSLTGDILQEWSVRSEQQKFSVEFLPTGVYYLLFISNESEESGIMIKDN